MSSVSGMFTVVDSFSRRIVELQNLFKWITRILGNLNIVISFSMLSTALHLEHLYPHLSIDSGAVYEFRQSVTFTYPVQRTALLGILTLRSMKLSKVSDLWWQFQHSILLISWPSKRSVIMLLSLALKYSAHLLLYSSMGSLSQSSSWYCGFVLILLSSL